MDQALLPIKIPQIDLQEYSNSFARMEQIERDYMAKRSNLRKTHNSAIQSDELKSEVDAHKKAQELIAAAIKRRTDLEKKYEVMSLREIRDALAASMKEKDAILHSARESALKHRSRETKEAIQQIKLQTDEEINAIRKVRNAKEGSQGMSIFGIASTFMGARVGFGKSNMEDLFKGGSSLPGGASISGIAASLGIGFGANELLKMGQAAAKADYQMIGAFKTAGATAMQASALVRQVTRDYEDQGQQIGLTEQEYKRLSQLAAFSGHFVGTQNAQLVRAAGAIEKQTAGGEGEITADRFIRAISQGVNSEEGKETFGRLRMAMPAFVKDLEQATDKEDLFRRAINGTNETVQAQIKWLQSDDGEVERETLHRENQAERLGKLMNKWLGASINLFSKLDVLADQFFGTLDAHDSEERKIIEDKVAYLEKALSNTPKNDTAAIDAYTHAIKQLKAQLADTGPENKDKAALDEVNKTLKVTAINSQSAADAQQKLISTLSESRDIVNSAEQHYAALYLTLSKLGNDPLVRAQLENAMRISGLIISENSKDLAKYNEGLTLGSKNDHSQIGGGKTAEQIRKEKFDKKILAVQEHYNQLLILAEQQAVKENWTKAKWDEKKLQLDKDERDAEIAVYKKFKYDFSILQIKQLEDSLNKEIDFNASLEKTWAERRDLKAKTLKQLQDDADKAHDEEWKQKEKDAKMYQEANEKRLAKEREHGQRYLEVVLNTAQRAMGTWESELWKPLDDRAAKSKNILISAAIDLGKGLMKQSESDIIDKILHPDDEKKTGIVKEGTFHVQQAYFSIASANALPTTDKIDPSLVDQKAWDEMMKKSTHNIQSDTTMSGRQLRAIMTGALPNALAQEGGGTNPEEAKRRALEEFRKEHPVNEEDNGEFTQGSKSLGGPVWDDVLRNIHIFQSKFSLSEGVHLGHGTDHFNLHGSRGIDPFSFGSGGIAEEGKGPGLNIWGKTDLADVGGKIAKSFAGGIEHFDVGKTLAKGMLSFIPGASFFSNLIPGFADGGDTPNGPFITGEDGPELNDGKGHIIPLGRRRNSSSFIPRSSYGGSSMGGSSEIAALHGTMKEISAKLDRQMVINSEGNRIGQIQDLNSRGWGTI